MHRTRTRWLISAVVVLVTMLLALVGAPTLRSALADSNRPQEYLALGDSVAFGYSQLTVNQGGGGNQANFIGYPTPVSETLKETLTNAACPGETSSHFITLSGSDNGCGTWRANFPLHVPYSTSQLAYADTFLQQHPKTLVVSIGLGSNDLFVLVNSCGGQAQPDVECIQKGLPDMLGTLSANLDTIYSHIRNTDGYHHKIVALTYYTFDYSNTFGVQLIGAVNTVLINRTLAYGGVVADGFGAFQAATADYGGDACKAGLLIVMTTSPLTCDIHPSVEGRTLLAQTVVSALRPD